MPNAKVLSEKQAIVEALTERLQGASAGIVIDYKGITVAEDTQLRANMRKEDVEYSVVKNTLLRFAAKNVGLDELDSVLNGTTSLATTSADPIAPFRIVKEFTSKLPKDSNKFVIKAAFMDGKMLSDSEVTEIAALPSKDALYGKVLGTMLAPITSLAVVLGQILEQKGGSLETESAEAAE
jgi:large subunit ribosomal protein L10